MNFIHNFLVCCNVQRSKENSGFKIYVKTLNLRATFVINVAAYFPSTRKSFEKFEGPQVEGIKLQFTTMFLRIFSFKN